MAGKEGFLARWSRRKRGEVPATDAERRAQQKPASDPAVETPAPRPAQVSPEAPPVVDLASLPPLDTIGAGSDIRAFLAPDVPPDLARAALRRAWSTDPTIRDFIGLSENSWDFNAPEGVPGFGSLSAEAIRRLLAQATGESDPKDGKSATLASPKEQEAELAKHSPPAENIPGDQGAVGSVPPVEPSEPDHGHIAMQQELDAREGRPRLPKRRHGGALPQ